MITPLDGIQVVDGVATAPKMNIGKSTDTKPTTGVPNGEGIMEMDTSKIYFFDLEGREWLEWGS